LTIAQGKEREASILEKDHQYKAKPQRKPTILVKKKQRKVSN
jgi:hypothetical protein